MPTPLPIPLEQKIANDLETKLKSKLGLKPTDSLPVELKNVVSKAAKDVDMSATERFVQKEAIIAGKQFFQDQNINAILGGRLSNALKGVQLISQSADLKQMINENAKILFLKKQALETAGFSTAEAFQLILAEVSAKAK